jgi:hypothetical protein
MGSVTYERRRAEWLIRSALPRRAASIIACDFFTVATAFLRR